ncbi:hypothetical protein AV654_19790 [Paenibacillus elgii]|uniref:Uncharacterized protein n=1 Tax=Paenibacillus elgii TaxID=189691 RepID=A0A161S1Z0_9BACL|nr:hypothetical protein [Paenibacillus elgii]KZE78219.1 hypothetical protein AV654_19790 [Paenibacillus elgii]
MTKQDLINSFPISEASFANDIAFYVVIGIGATLLITLLAVLITRNSEAYGIGSIIVIPVIVFAFWQATNNEFERTNELINAKIEWKKSFYASYLPQVPEQRFEVLSHTVNKDGTVSVILKSDLDVKTIGSISSVQYYTPTTSESGIYVTARYVEGLEKVEIKNGLYDPTIFFPKK